MKYIKKKTYKRKSSILLTIYSYLCKHINFKIGTISGIITGTIVFYINIEHGFYPALASFLKQFFFNLFMAGYNTKTCEKLATKIKHDFFGITVGTITPTIQAFVILYAIHFFGRTPKPMDSTLWQVFPNIIFFFFMSLIYRDKIKITNKLFYKITRIFKLKTHIRKRRIQKITEIDSNTTTQ